MKLNPYLLFNGQCEAAFNFYAKSLDGKIVAKVTHGESPMAKDTPPERHNKILHASLTVGGDVLMGSDAPPDRYEKPQGFSVTLNLDPGRGRTHLRSLIRKRDFAHATAGDILGRPLRHAGRSIRHPMDD
jgi:uncharacterized glyoxalase superfamily protein PhnB